MSAKSDLKSLADSCSPSIDGLNLTASTSGGKDKKPLPSPLRNDYRIIFVDPYNVGRSRVAEAYMQLIREWTIRSKGTWHVKDVHSAGLMVKSQSDCVEVLQKLQPPLKQHFLPGGEKPTWTGMASLFDNSFFNYPYKKNVRDKALVAKSRGIRQNIFSEYDWILVFTGRESENLLRLKKALIDKNGKGAAPKGKGRVLHLGGYLGRKGESREIVNASKNKDGTESRENWNKTTASIKMAIRWFLRRELDWVQPAKGAAVS